jgi:hypothetical protein
MNKPRFAVTTLLLVAALLWTVTIGAMYRAVRRFESTPGRAADALPSWPAASTISRAPGSWTLLTLIHPHCSCSRATIQELQAILEKAPALQSYVLVYRPAEFVNGWEKTDVVASALRLPRTKVMIDTDAREARLFGGFTSGQTFLYDTDGRLRFSGGVTALRGHAGLNRAVASVIRIANTHSGSAAHPVFGCAIVSHEEGGLK